VRSSQLGKVPGGEIAAQGVVEGVQRTGQWKHVRVQDGAVKRLLSAKDPSPPWVGQDPDLLSGFLISGGAPHYEHFAVGARF
jgi:hypothetical protein